MTAYSNTLRDQNQKPIAGAKVYVYNSLGALDTLTSDGVLPLANPVTSDEFGNFAFHAGDGVKTLDIFKGGLRAWKEVISIGGGDIPTLTALGLPGGSNAVGFLHTGTGAVARTVQTKLQDTIHVKDFGAVCDGVANDTAAVQNAINAGAAQGKSVVLPKAIKHGALTLPAGTHLIGPGGKSTVTALAGNYSLYKITGSDVTVENLIIEAAAKTGGYEFEIACGTATIERTTICNILGLNSRGAITDSGTTGKHITTRLQSIQFRLHNGPGLSWTRGFAFLFFNEMVIDFVGVATSDFTGFFCDFAAMGAGSGGIFFRDCDVLGTAGTTNLANQRGFNIANAAAVSIFNSRADTLGDYGFNFNNINKLIVDDASSSLNAGHAFVYTSVTNATLTGANAYGRNGLGYAPASIDGFRFVTGNANIVINGGVARDCTGHGVHKTAAQAGPIDIRGMASVSNVGRGVKSVGNSAFVFTGTLNGNTAGNYDIGGAFDWIAATMLASGAVVTNGPGPLTA